MKVLWRYAIPAAILLFAFLAFSVLLLTATEATAGGLLCALSSLNLTILSARRIPVFSVLTDLLLAFALLICLAFAAKGAYCLLKGRRPSAVDRYLWYLGALYALMIAAYLLFEAIPLSECLPSATWAPFAEYPSSHTLVACVVFPSAALTVRLLGPLRRYRYLLDALAATLWLFMAAGRILAGEHLFTDVAGACLFGIACNLLYAAFLLPLTKSTSGIEKKETEA